jgi:hypothetical protein
VSTVRKERKVITKLIYAGALPFIFTTMVALIGPNSYMYLLDARALFNSYALIICCFLCGALWGLGLAKPDKLPVNVFLWGNSAVVLLWFSWYLLPTFAYRLVLLLVLLWLLWIDRRLLRADIISSWYFKLRVRITAMVTVCVVLLLVFT